MKFRVWRPLLALLVLGLTAVTIVSAPAASAETEHDVDIRGGALTVREIQNLAEGWLGMRGGEPAAALFALSDGPTLAAGGFDRLLAGEEVDGIELRRVTERPGPDTTFSGLAGETLVAARQIWVWGFRIPQWSMTIVVVCSRETPNSELKCKGTVVDD